ncbi:MAG: hypothetical protein IT470_08465 [Pseudomonadales bacterium]|nr:hypothetical protein [Pseudomonadales bacterium]
MKRGVLVLDQGGHSTRALVFADDGAVVAQSRIEIATQSEAAGFVEQDPQSIASSLQQVLLDIAAQLGTACSRIVAAALIVQRSSLLAVRRSTGDAITPVLSWQDTRNARWLDQQVAGQQRYIRQLTGLYPNAHYGVSKMRWLLDNDDAVAAAAQRSDLCITPLAGYLRTALTHAQDMAVDAVVASRTLLTELSTCAWSKTLLDFFNIPEAILPQVKPTVSDCGVIRIGDTSVPLKLLGGDQSGFLLAHQCEDVRHTVFINIGTGAFLQQLMPVNQIPEKLLAAPLSLTGDVKESVIVAEGTVNAAATALDWWQVRSGVQLSEMYWLHALAESQQRPDAVPVFINRITASGSPDWLPAGESFFSATCSLSLQAIAVLESIVFALQRNLDALAQNESRQMIVVSGGLAQNALLCQCLADLSATQVARSVDVESCARGAAVQLLPGALGIPRYDFFLPQPSDALVARYRHWSSVMG